jgi:methylated-DNA-[protein]-cysteine S-methyltransferase
MIKKLTKFQKKVLALTAKIPKGKITTYGEMAKLLRSSPRAVGRALGANPWPVEIPCHRVIKSDGGLGGYSGGVKKKKKLFQEEGIKIQKNKVVNFKKYLIGFKIQKNTKENKNF